ncbi:MAG: hypothetical protein E6Q88_12165 [Lysobacteraceae bacterium]|nr:MAG: hypothetical protein E6Q88_12165 [Xanthomonadaceae bacterium]
MDADDMPVPALFLASTIFEKVNSMKCRVSLLLALLVPSVAIASMYMDKPVVSVTGDSYTRRTICAEYSTYDSCDSAGMVKHQLSYSTYLNAVTRYQVVMTDNSGRGGDTCLTTTSKYTSGPWAGQVRGIKDQVSTRILNRPSEAVSILIGINDVNLYGVTEHQLKECLKALYFSITNSGRKVVAMTYPPVTTTTGVWMPTTSGLTASYNVEMVNRAVRAAVTEHNGATGSRPPVFLAETSRAWGAGAAASFTEDGAHPNMEGALLIARVWFSDVCKARYLACNP